MATDQETTRVGRRKCPTCGLELQSSVTVCPQDGTALNTPINIDQAFANYDFLASIGEGGMGVIYKARHRHLNKIVAIKTLHSHLTNPELIRRFQIEGKAASILSHPNIISVFDFGLTQTGQPYMIMDFVDGQTLSDALRQYGQIPMQQFLPIFLQVCDALSHAHTRAVLHRDVKPSNIMLVRSPRNDFDVRIMDFGIAKLMNEQESGQNLTKTGDAIGSPIYMSPEQARGGKMDHRSDLYSLGCVMYEAITGSPPFCGNTALDTMMMHIESKPMPLNQASMGSKIDKRLQAIIMRLLEKDQNDRYQSMDEVRNDLITLQNPDDTVMLPSVKDSQLSTQVRKKAEANANAKSGKFVDSKYLMVGGVSVGVLALIIVLFMAYRTLSTQKEAEVEVESAKPSNVQAKRTVSDVEKKSAHHDPYAATTKTFDDLGDARQGIIDQVKHNSQSIAVSVGYDNPQLVTDSDLAILKSAKVLNTVGLRGLKISDKGLENISNLKSVTRVIVSQTLVKTLKALANMTQLSELQASKTQLETEAYGNIAKLKNLQALDLSFTPITDQDLAKLFALRELTTVMLEGCYNLTPLGIDRFRNALPKCIVVQGPLVDKLASKEKTLLVAPSPMKLVQSAKERMLANDWMGANEKVTQAIRAMEPTYDQEVQITANVLKGDCMEHFKLPVAAGIYYGLAAKLVGTDDARIPKIYDKIAVGFESLSHPDFEDIQSAIYARERVSEYLEHAPESDSHKTKAPDDSLADNQEKIARDNIKLHRYEIATRIMKQLSEKCGSSDTTRKARYEKLLDTLRTAK